MAETASTLIDAALRKCGAISPGETPNASERSDALLDMKMMLRNWSAQDIILYYTEQDTVTTDGSTSYTIGDGGDVDTVRPTSIRGAYVSGSIDSEVRIVDEAKYRREQMKSLGGTTAYLWYSPEFPLGLLRFWPLSSDTIILDSLKPLSEPANIEADVSLPPEYDEAIVFNLAVRLASDYGVSVSPEVAAIAVESFRSLSNRNFASQIVAVRPEILQVVNQYNINDG